MSGDEKDLRGKVAVVGVAESALGQVGPGISPLDLIGQAVVAALDDAGLRKDEIDGLFSHSAFFGMPNVMTAQYLGIRPRYTDSTAIGGSSFVAHLHHAAAAITAGLCDVALITYGSVQRSAGGLMTSGSTDIWYESVFRPVFPVSAYALAAARHMHQYGTTREQLAEVAVAARQWAQRNPAAFMRDDLTLEDVLASRLVSSPLRVRDCCLVTDGGGAVLVTSAERARDLKRDPVYLLGAAEAHWNMNISQMDDLTVTAASESGPRAMSLAGVKPSEVDLVELYDAFTINTILFLEDLGFCAKGEGGAFVSGGRIAPGGELPVNTNGGGLSFCHPGMYGIFTIIEAVRQLRGDGGDRQVTEPHVAVAHGNGGHLSSQVTAILGDESTL
jgi:acetyl-CoA acetyltransferase